MESLPSIATPRQAPADVLGRKQGSTAAVRMLPPSLATPRQDPAAEALERERVPAGTMSTGMLLPPGLQPRPPRHARREHLRARALNRRSLPATSRQPSSRHQHPLDKPAQRRYHTERATRRVFARVPTYLPRMKQDVFKPSVQESCTEHEQVEGARGTSEASAPSRRRNKTDRPSKKPMSKIEARMQEMQLIRDKAAIKEAFGVIDDDGGGSVEAPEVLKALKALGKKLDDKKFWGKFQKLCDEGEMVISAAHFETLMLKMLESSRRKAAREQLGGELLKEKVSASSFYAKRAANSMGQVARHGIKNRLNRVRERTEFGQAQDNVRSTRSEGAQNTIAEEGADASQHVATKTRKKTKKAASPSQEATPLKRGPPQTPEPLEKDGSQWMVEALEQHRGLADIYSALTALQSSAVQAQIVKPPEDLR
eukprot:COSAG02_NODE_4760_length_5017_cov_7.215331_3_plen_426_part_00